MGCRQKGRASIEVVQHELSSVKSQSSRGDLTFLLINPGDIMIIVEGVMTMADLSDRASSLLYRGGMS